MQRQLLAQTIRDALSRSGKSREALAKEVKVHRATVSRWASGDCIMRVEYAPALAAALGIDAEILKALAQGALNEAHPAAISVKVEAQEIAESLRMRFQLLESRTEVLELRVRALERELELDSGHNR